MGKGSFDWLAVLDFDRALTNCHRDFLGDWYRDPWGWPELDWLVKEKHTGLLVPRLTSAGIRRVARLDVAKENFGVRPAMIMDPTDRLVYQALVDRLSARLIGDAPPWVYGWRLTRKSPKNGVYANQDREWARYRSHLGRLAKLYTAALKTDVVSFFRSIPVSRIAEDLQSRVHRTKVSERLIDMLDGFDGVHDRGGLAQRSAASAALANFYLGPLDELLAQFGRIRGLAAKTAPEGRALRWMDDIWIFGPRADRLRAIQVELQTSMQDLGLYMNLGKTHVFEGDDVAREANRIEHSAVDADLSASSPSLVPLNQLIDELLENPEQADRTSVRFITTRMRQRRLFARVGDFVNEAHRLPHGSDALARLFRESEVWRDLQAWFVRYAGTPWACIDWSLAQFGTMFPARKRVDSKLRDYFTDVLVKGAPHALAGLAAQRMAAWKPDDARLALREAANFADHPLLRRNLALSALQAGEKRALIRKLLAEFEENQVTLAMLADRSFKPIRAKADFQGA